MRFQETRLPGVIIVSLERIEDERGFFARSFCQEEFAARGLSSVFVQCNISLNRRRGTLRGMHYQVFPHEEAKLVRCTMGAIYDVALDLRPNSATYCQWVSIELTAANHDMLYIPEGIAHGFQTLMDDCEVFYQMSASYHPECARGVRWDDPSAKIEWPLATPIVSAKDRSFPDLVCQSAFCSPAPAAS